MRDKGCANPGTPSSPLAPPGRLWWPSLVVSALLLLLPTITTAGEDDTVELKRPGFRIEVPETVLAGVPVKFVRIQAVDKYGQPDPTYDGQPLITGVTFTERHPTSGVEVEQPLGAFENGKLELETDLQRGRKVYLTASKIVVTPQQGAERTREAAARSVDRLWRWWSIVPPLLAVVLAVWLRNVIVALFAGVWCGAVILTRGDVLAGFLRTLDTYLIGEVVRGDGGEHPHMLIILFTLFLGAMIGVMSRSGGTQAIVNSLIRVTKTREHGQVLTWGMGFAVFFDDYANTLLLGSTMRPVTDRLKISREKLAFLVDSTAAPVAGLAMISTWVGVEVSLIGDTYEQLFGENTDWNGYSAFLASLPYRFYALHLLVFVLLIAYSGHDYGPMLQAEARAMMRGDADAAEESTHATRKPDADSSRPTRILLRNALIPLGMLIVGIAVGLWWTGAEGLAAHNKQLRMQGRSAQEATLWSMLQHSASSRVIFYAAFLASASAVLSAVVFRCLKLREAIDAWIDGAKTMFTAIVILVMAWAVATICNPDHLNTAGFVVELVGGRVSAVWTPGLAFVVAAVISFATGSSYATMGLLLPLFITMTFYLLAGENDADPYHHLLLATIGAVLAGSIFGDHCSPISDTTVLSSAATGCDHLSHVGTQLPYAMTVGVVSLLLGYLPAGFNVPPYVLLPIGLIVLYVLIQFWGRPPETIVAALRDTSVTTAETPDDPPSAATSPSDSTNETAEHPEADTPEEPHADGKTD